MPQPTRPEPNAPQPADDPTGPDPGGVGRYAPSPTSDLHVGNLRTALVAWLFARSTGRRFLMRVEDLDVARVAHDPTVAGRQLEDLAAIGVAWDSPLWRQSERREVYEAAVAQLAEGPGIYPCFCSRREIREAASAPHAPVGVYPGTCRDLSEADRARRAAHRPAAWRVRGPGVGATVHDQMYGPVTEVVDDFVLRRNDGAFAYNLAVVVDDLAAGIDQVVRGRDLLDSTPRQAWLAHLLGGRAPAYAHVPLVVNEEGQRLAKRDGAVTLADLQAQGMTAARVRSVLAVSLGLAEEGEPVTMDQLLARFDPARVPRQDWVFRPPAGCR